MSKLEELYANVENLQGLGMRFREDTLAAIAELEEELIKSDILPAMSQDVEPLLSPIKRDLVLVVEYHPGEPISVALSRKTKITDIEGTKLLTDSAQRKSTPVTANQPAAVRVQHVPTRQVENHTKGLKVTFPDGTVVLGRNAIDTFVQTIRQIGFERVEKVGIRHRARGQGESFNLVSRERRPPKSGVVWQHECDGWYVYTLSSNKSKRVDLQKISDELHLGLIIEDGKPES